MAISVTVLQGTSSISADRITINDNFATVVDGINNLLGILDTTTGKFDNTGVGANSVIVTEGLTVTLDGIDIVVGDLGLDAGNVILNADESYIQLGSAGSQLAEKIFPKVSSGNFSGLDISLFDLVKLPKKTTAEIADIDTANLEGGELVYDSTTNTPKYFNTVAWVAI
jgi:hypothetical protein